jgi:hypothetical protein
MNCAISLYHSSDNFYKEDIMSGKKRVFMQLLQNKLMFVGLGCLLMLGCMLGCSDDSDGSDSPSAAAPAIGSYALIYNGPVAAEEGPEAVAEIAEQVGLPVTYIADITELPRLLPDARVFIVGGTEDDLSPLINPFTPDVRAALENYLRNGGRYLGICGGGFLASTGWEEKEDFVEMLGIIPAKSGDFEDVADPMILPINWLGTIYDMYFQGGPAFELEDSPESVLVIAKYADGEIAALISSYGNGKVAVSGPHPEAPDSWGEEAEDGEDWTAVTDLAVDFLQELLSDRPVNP